MIYTITKDWTFAAAHSLPLLPPDHQCYRTHGHNYRVTVYLETHDLDPHGFVVDYGVLSRDLGTWIKDTFDHRNLNDVIPVTTAERLAHYIYEKAVTFGWGHMVTGVTVLENDTSSATYTG